MENIVTQSGIGNNKKDSLTYGAAEEAIALETKKIRNLIQKFIAFCEQQQKNWIGWTAFTMAAQAFVLAPITLIAVVANGNRFALWMPVIVSSFVVEISNLANMPTKINIPVFCASVLINVGVIILSFMH